MWRARRTGTNMPSTSRFRRSLHYAGDAAAVAAAGATAYASAQPAARNEYADTRYGDFDGDDRLAGDHAPEAYRAMDDDDLAYDPELNEDMAVSSYQDAAQRQSSGSRRGLMLAAIVGGVVLIGGIGAYALSGGVDGSGALPSSAPIPIRSRSGLKIRAAPACRTRTTRSSRP